MKEKPKYIKIAWAFIFAIFYPIITTFSVLFMWIIGLLSSISSIIVKLAKKIHPN